MTKGWLRPALFTLSPYHFVTLPLGGSPARYTVLMTVRTRAIREGTGAVDEAALLTYYGCTPDDWEEVADERRFVEFIDERLMVHSPVGLAHQSIFDFVYRIMGACVERQALGRVLAGPFVMELSYLRKFEPDIMFLLPATAMRLADDRLVGAADLVIEIASPSTRAYDSGEKREAYRVGGVRDYWMIDPAKRLVTLDRPAGHEIASTTVGVVRSETCIGFWLKAEWLWADPLPTVEFCLAEILAS